MTALVTPFRSGDLDWPCLKELVDRQVDSGTDWLVALGTTAESPTLTRDERSKLLDVVIARAAGRCPVMAGTGSNNTTDTVEQTKRAAAAGADAALVVAPYYSRPTPEGLFRHYAAVAESADLPIVVYNVPVRTGVDVGADVVARLSERYPHIAGLKDATGRVDAVTDLRTHCDVAVLCGDDALTWPMMALGAVGVISVLANLVPMLMKSLVTAGMRGDRSAVLPLHRKVHDLATGIGRFGPNPLPIKTAMAHVGLLADEYRLPLCPLDAEAGAAIAELLRRHEIGTRSCADATT
jgi:4-hydroxy-tetrahydrodipicolinate synthase